MILGVLNSRCSSSVKLELFRIFETMNRLILHYFSLMTIIFLVKRFDCTQKGKHQSCRRILLSREKRSVTSNSARRGGKYTKEHRNSNKEEVEQQRYLSLNLIGSVIVNTISSYLKPPPSIISASRVEYGTFRS